MTVLCNKAIINGHKKLSQSISIKIAKSNKCKNKTNLSEESRNVGVAN